MNKYRHRGGESGVVAFDTGPLSITIQFKDGATYRYTCASTGTRAIDEMKKLAAKGRGLATYINKHVRDRYAAKLR